MKDVAASYAPDSRLVPEPDFDEIIDVVSLDVAETIARVLANAARGNTLDAWRGTRPRELLDLRQHTMDFGRSVHGELQPRPLTRQIGVTQTPSDPLVALSVAGPVPIGGALRDGRLRLIRRALVFGAYVRLP